MTVHYADATVTLHAGDCLDVLATLADASVDSVVTDPPAGISFMSKTWDHDKGGRTEWVAWLTTVMAECCRVLKPGGHALVWALPRTSHWTAWAIEDGGMVIRDCITHLFGTGFPKSLDVGKAIDREAGMEREVVGRKADPRYTHAFNGTASSPMGNVDPRRERSDHGNLTAPATDAARQWQGWGTSLKPASEHWWLARKPLVGTVAGNVQAFGTGALNIDACRIGTDSTQRTRTADDFGIVNDDGWVPKPGINGSTAGRWPANVVLDDDQARALDQQSGDRPGMPVAPNRRGESPKGYGMGVMPDPDTDGYGDTGGASRFFLTAERDLLPIDDIGARFKYTAKADGSERPRVNGESHATVKPLSLMRWLVRLVTPPGGTILEPFAGSGTTIEAAILEGFRCIAIEREMDYLPLCLARIHRRRDPVAAIRLSTPDDLGLFGDFDGAA